MFQYEGTTTLDLFPSWYIPILVLYYSVFFIAFEFCLNFYAELTGFADRQFYQDFWNATNFDEFARKWNRPVHEYLHRHIYLDQLKTHRTMTVFQATVYTFIYSVYFHELFMTCLFKRWFTFYLTGLQIYQLLLYFMFAKLKGTVTGNLIYWFGTFFSVTSVLYLYCYDLRNFSFNRGNKNLYFDY